MDRSRINDILDEGAAFMARHGFALPPFAHWSPERMRASDAAPIRAAGLGWDITDYGQGRWDEMGLFLFTTRNGTLAELTAGRGMVYAEKIMISRDRQLSPMHRHNLKTEDIINRGGGTLVLELFASRPDGSVDRDAEITVATDGVPVTLPAGGRLRLAPGASVTLRPGDWHAFWAEGGDCLIGEVSTVNDDRTDNVFEMDIPRFAQVTEDVAAARLLVSDYAA